MKVSEQLAIIKAYKDGKTIERLYTCSNGNTMWETIKEYKEDYPFNFQANNYRIKDEETYSYTCGYDWFTQCIPYNDDTKHLLGTNKDTPEFYRYWED